MPEKLRIIRQNQEFRLSILPSCSFKGLFLSHTGERNSSFRKTQTIKKLLILCVTLFAMHGGRAQENVQQTGRVHQHKGFYLSLNAGPVFGNVTDQVNPYGYTSPTLNYTGTGTLLEASIGAAIYENIILHATLISNLLAGPTVTSTASRNDINPAVHKLPGTFGISESMLGIGFTRYLMPSNLYLSATMGAGYYATKDSKNSENNVSTDPGFSMQVKVGREWWISQNWALGLGLSYGKTKLRNISSDRQVELLNSNRIGISLTTTFN